MGSLRLHLTITGRPAAPAYSTLPTTTAALVDGSWSCVPDGADTAVTFAARLAADHLEPVAVRSLIDDTVAIVSGLFGGTVRVDDVVVQAHPRAQAKLPQAAAPAA